MFIMNNDFNFADIRETELFLEKNACRLSRKEWKSIIENTELSEEFIDKNFNDWCQNAKYGIEMLSLYRNLSAGFIAEHLRKGLDFRDLLINKQISYDLSSCMAKAAMDSVPSGEEWRLDDYYDKIVANIEKACYKYFIEQECLSDTVLDNYMKATMDLFEERNNMDGFVPDDLYEDADIYLGNIKLVPYCLSKGHFESNETSFFYQVKCGDRFVDPSEILGTPDIFGAEGENYLGDLYNLEGLNDDLIFNYKWKDIIRERISSCLENQRLRETVSLVQAKFNNTASSDLGSIKKFLLLSFDHIYDVTDKIINSNFDSDVINDLKISKLDECSEARNSDDVLKLAFNDSVFKAFIYDKNGILEKKFQFCLNKETAVFFNDRNQLIDCLDRLDLNSLKKFIMNFSFTANKAQADNTGKRKAENEGEEEEASLEGISKLLDYEDKVRLMGILARDIQKESKALLSMSISR